MAGETVAVSGSAVRNTKGHVGSGMFWIEYDLTYGASNNELNDVMQAGYLPAYTRVVAVAWAPTDMDTGIAAVVHKVSVGSTDIVTGLTGAQTGAASFTVATSAAIRAAVSSSEQLVTVTSTTAAATGAAGTAKLLLMCQYAKA